jgi:hypothetical protein
MIDHTGYIGSSVTVWQVKTYQLVVAFGELESLLARIDLFGHAVDLIIENITQSFGEYQRQNEVLVLGCVFSSSHGTGHIPDPGFERFVISVIFGHLIFVLPLLPDIQLYAYKQPRNKLTRY